MTDDASYIPERARFITPAAVTQVSLTTAFVASKLPELNIAGRVTITASVVFLAGAAILMTASSFMRPQPRAFGWARLGCWSYCLGVGSSIFFVLGLVWWS